MRLRKATRDDVDALLEIDAACFPEGMEDRQPVKPAEITAGVEASHVVVAEDRTGIVGFIQVDIPTEDHLYIVAIDVRPDMQHRRVGSQLLEHVLGMVPADDLTVSSISATQNLGMLRLLLSHGFVVTAVMRDYHGPGNDRFYCQYRTNNGFADRENVYLIPLTNPQSVYRLLDSPDYVMTDIVTSVASGLAMYEVSRVEIGDRPAMQATESTTGIIFSGVMLLAVLLVSDLVWAGSSAPLTFMTVPMVFASVGSLVVRVSTSADSIRRGTGRFDAHMIWGGVLSEYGSIVPMALLLPALLNTDFFPVAATLIMGIGASAALVAYEFSGFSIHSRYSGWIIMWLLAILTSIMPAAASILASFGNVSEELWWMWSVTAIVALGVRAVLMGRTATRWAVH